VSYHAWEAVLELIVSSETQTPRGDLGLNQQYVQQRRNPAPMQQPIQFKMTKIPSKHDISPQMEEFGAGNGHRYYSLQSAGHEADARQLEQVHQSRQQI